jgi:site-specific DNA recombinase
MSRKLRAASYCRTSSEGQRDNTSINGIQKPRCEAVAQQNGWEFVRHYVDECKSGSKIAGRDDFQQAMRDAANGLFDILIPFDIDRFARDGLDILNSARTLRRDFQVDVVDTSGRYDTRDPKNVLMQYVSAGMAEQERLKILDRTMSGRMANARLGKPWCSNLPKGRQYDNKAGWSVSEFGGKLKQLLTRYVKGESLTHLCREFGISNRRRISDWVNHGQLAGEYQASFHSPEIGIHNAKISLPAIPEDLQRTPRESESEALSQSTSESPRCAEV